MAEEDLRRLYRRDYANQPVRTGPLNQSSTSPIPPQPVTEPTTEPRAPEPEPQAPPEQPEPAHIHIPAGDELPAPPPTSRRKHKPRKRNFKKYLLIFILLIACLAIGGAIAYYQTRKTPNQTSTASTNRFPSSLTSQISSPLYYPVNLPAGYTVNNDYKVIKPDIFYYTVKDSKNNIYYVTIKPISASSDPVSFNKTFTNANQFTTSAGSATVGYVGSAPMASIVTNKNSWILIVSGSKDVQPQLETISKAFQQSR